MGRQLSKCSATFPGQEDSPPSGLSEPCWERGVGNLGKGCQRSQGRSEGRGPGPPTGLSKHRDPFPGQEPRFHPSSSRVWGGQRRVPPPPCVPGLTLQHHAARGRTWRDGETKVQGWAAPWPPFVARLLSPSEPWRQGPRRANTGSGKGAWSSGEARFHHFPLLPG